MPAADSPSWDLFVHGLTEARPAPQEFVGTGRIPGHMLRNSSLLAGRAESTLQQAPQWLAGLVHYRLLPGIFPHGMHYHFDGLATPVRFAFDSTSDGAGGAGPSLSWHGKPYESNAFKGYKSCLFFGTGTGPTLGTHLCFANPGVNLLPIEGPAGQQLWLTIDTASWGQVDPMTLATLPGPRWGNLPCPVHYEPER